MNEKKNPTNKSQSNHFGVVCVRARLLTTRLVWASVCVRVLFNGIWNRKLLFYRNKCEKQNSDSEIATKQQVKQRATKRHTKKKSSEEEEIIRSTFDGNNKNVCENVYMNIHRAKHAIAKRLISTVFQVKAYYSLRRRRRRCCCDLRLTFFFFLHFQSSAKSPMYTDASFRDSLARFCFFAVVRIFFIYLFILQNAIHE